MMNVFKRTQQENSYMILEGNLWKTVLLLAIPVMLSNLMHTMYNLIDTFWVGRIGEVEISSISFVFPIIAISHAVALGLNIAGSSIISQNLGANNRLRSEKIAAELLCLAIICGLILSVIQILFAGVIVDLMRAPIEINQLSTNYLRIIGFGNVLVFIFNIYQSISQAEGDTISPMLINMMGVLLNIILDPIFIFVFKFGVEGVAIATVISRLIIMPFALKMIFNPRDPNKLRIKVSNMTLIKSDVHKIIKIGAPASIGHALSSVGFAVMNVFIVSYGTQTMAAFVIGNRISGLFMIPVMGFGSVLAAIVGQNIGAGNYKRVFNSLKVSLVISVSIMSMGSTLLLIFGDSFAKVFVKSDPIVLKMTVDYINVLSFTIIFLAILQCFFGLFQGAGKTMLVMILPLIRLWGLRIPMIIFLKNHTDYGSTGIWFAMLLSNMVIDFIAYIIYSRKKWLKSSILTEKNLNVAC